MLPMQQLEHRFGLSQFSDWPNAQGLNALRAKSVNHDLPLPKFVCQDSLPKTDAYYEQIIFQQGIIPTRKNSWHDLFNGLIWLQFPHTKRLLNQYHVQDIAEFGLSPRTLRRNNITHFDECGVILSYQKNTLAEQLFVDLADHNWHQALLNNRQVWGKQLNSFIFGHANLEMLLQPFIGLTGKFLAVEVDQHFAQLPYAQQLSELDVLVMQRLRDTDILQQKKPLSPLPLLGIPGVWDANKDPKFYANTDYFRPKPQAKSQLK